MISVSTTIKTEKQAQAAMLDTLKSPPQTPVQAVQWLTKNVNFSSAFGKTIGGLAPGVGSVIGSLTEIFSAFSSVPSLGEMVMDGLSNLSNQIADLKNELTATIEKTAELQTQKTVDYVLQGVDEIQQEVSAIEIMQSVTAESMLQEMAEQKAQIKIENLAEIEAMQRKAYADIKILIDNCELELSALYESIMMHFGALGMDFYSYLQSLMQTNAPAASVRAVVAPSNAIEKKKEPEPGFNWLYLSPLVLLFFMKKKK